MEKSVDVVRQGLIVETYTTVGTVCAAALLWGLVDLNVLDDQVAGVETLGVGVGLSVLEQAQEELGGLDWPAGLGDTELLACVLFSVYVVSPYASSHMAPHLSAMGLVHTLGSTASAPGISSHWDSLALVLDVLEVFAGAAELPAVDGLGGLARVLEGNPEVGAASWSADVRQYCHDRNAFRGGMIITASALGGIEVFGGVADHLDGMLNGGWVVYDLVWLKSQLQVSTKLECVAPSWQNSGGAEEASQTLNQSKFLSSLSCEYRAFPPTNAHIHTNSTSWPSLLDEAVAAAIAVVAVVVSEVDEAVLHVVVAEVRTLQKLRNLWESANRVIGGFGGGDRGRGGARGGRGAPRGGGRGGRGGARGGRGGGPGAKVRSKRAQQDCENEI